MWRLGQTRHPSRPATWRGGGWRRCHVPEAVINTLYKQHVLAHNTYTKGKDDNDARYDGKGELTPKRKPREAADEVAVAHELGRFW